MREHHPAEQDAEWVIWAGGQCPVQPDDRIYIRRRDLAETVGTVRAGDYNWEHNNLHSNSDIVGYRIALATSWENRPVQVWMLWAALMNLPEGLGENAAEKLVKAVQRQNGQ